VVRPNYTKASIFASSPGVRLEGASVETSYFAKIGFQLLLSGVSEILGFWNLTRTEIILEYPCT
jgi:hypothetical protein